MALVNVLFVLTICSLNRIAHVSSQICTNSTDYGSCSSNPSCGCLLDVNNGDTGLCGLWTLSCSSLATCQTPYNTCAQSGYVCVRHPQCSLLPVCYPSTSIDEETCPLVIVSTYTSELDSSDQTYTRPSSGQSNHYFEAFQIMVSKSGVYEFKSESSMDTLGYIYNGTFYRLNPTTNLIKTDDDGAGNNQFLLRLNLEANVPYTLVVSTHGAGIQGPYSINATGPSNVQFMKIQPMEMTTTTTPPPVYTTHFAGALTSVSPTYTRHGGSGSFFYQAIEVRVPVTGEYTFTASGSIDTFGYLYQGNFYPSYPEYNIVKQDDDGAGSSQFKITATLRSDLRYILVFTTFNQLETTSFNVAASGPGSPSLAAISA